MGGAEGVGSTWGMVPVRLHLQGLHGPLPLERCLVISRYAVGRIRPKRRIRQVRRDRSAEPWIARPTMPPMPKHPGIGRAVGAGTLMTWPQVHTVLAPTSCELRVDRGLEMSGRAALHGIYAGFRLMARCWSGTTATIADPGVVV